MTLLKALQASRQRQAEREIHRFRHLMDEANAAELRHAIARAHAQAPRRGSSSVAVTPARDARPAWPFAAPLKRVRMWMHAQHLRAQPQGRLGS